MITSEHASAILERAARIPIFDTLRMHDVEFDAGICSLSVPRQRMYDGVFDSFHGGILMTVADSAACFAVLTLTPADQVLATTDMNIRFLAPCLTDLRVTARVIKLGRRFCPASVDLTDTNGTLVAIAQVNYVRLARMPGR